jgi:hypothetical protein
MIMSLDRAFRYLFRGNTPGRILQIVLIYGLVVFPYWYANLQVLLYGNQDGLIKLLLFISPFLLLGFSVMLNGYFVRVLRHLRDGDEQIPRFNAPIGDLGRGFVVGLGSLFYFLVPVFGYSLIPVGPATAPSTEFSYVAGFLLVSLIAALVFMVGVLRYAFEERAGALFGVFGNIKLIGSNIGALIGLLLRMAVMLVAGSAVLFALYVAFFFLLGTAGGNLEVNPALLIGVMIIMYLITMFSVLVTVLAGLNLLAGFGRVTGVTVPDVQKKKKQAPQKPY